MNCVTFSLHDNLDLNIWKLVVVKELRVIPSSIGESGDGPSDVVHIGVARRAGSRDVLKVEGELR